MRIDSRSTRIKLKGCSINVKFGNRKSLNNRPMPDVLVSQYPLLAEKCDLNAHADALRWLSYDRHITAPTIAAFKLRLYVNPLDDVGVLFPILDKDGETVLDMWARLISDKNFFRVTQSLTGSAIEYKAPNLFFGNHLFNPEKPVLLVEGAIDALRLHSLGFKNVLAAFGSLSNEQIESLYAPVVYLGFDNDAAGHEFTKKAVAKLRVPSISILDWGVVGIKDAGELESRGLRHSRPVHPSRLSRSEVRGRCRVAFLPQKDHFFPKSKKSRHGGC